MADKKTYRVPRTDMPDGRIAGWVASEDGRMISHVFLLDTATAAAQHARRALNLAQRAGQIVEVRLSGETVTVRFPASDGKVPHRSRLIGLKLMPKTEETVSKRQPRQSSPKGSA